MMPKTTTKSTGMVTAKTRALRKSMVKAITMAPSTMKAKPAGWLSSLRQTKQAM